MKYKKNPIGNLQNNNFLILDSLWGDLDDFNKRKLNYIPFIFFKEPVINNLHFINPDSVSNYKKYLKYKKIKHDYDFITTLNEYGSKVFIFHLIVSLLLDALSFCKTTERPKANSLGKK